MALLLDAQIKRDMHTNGPQSSYCFKTQEVSGAPLAGNYGGRVLRFTLTTEKLFETKLGSVNQSIKSMDSKLDKNIVVMSRGIATITEELKSLKAEQTKQGVQIEQIKQEERNTNLIFHGINQPNYQDTLTKIIEIMNSVGIQGSKYLIKNIRKLGKGNWNELPILVSFVSNPLKIDIIRNKKTIGELHAGVVIKDDMSKETREARSALSKFAKMATEKGYKAVMKKDKLLVHGKMWTLEELQKDSTNSFLSKPKRPREEESPPNASNVKKTLNSIENYLTKTNPTEVSTENSKMGSTPKNKAGVTVNKNK
ncbi:hypothetical protein WDU94_002234 [Cyamophila willieti]